MKIKGWEKINGFTYKGYCIVNPIHNADETRYMVDVLDLNQSSKPKWELNLLTPKHKFMGGNEFIVNLWDDNKLNTRVVLPKDMISDLSKFRQVFEHLVENMLQLRLQKATTFSSHSLHTNPINTKASKAGGIVNHINNSGTTIQWQNIQSQAINAMQDLQKQIDKLNNNANN